MKILEQTCEIISPAGEAALKAIEYAARNCYASQDRIAEGTCRTFVKSLINRQHEAPLEFASMTVDITTSRDVLAELTRHRLASFCVESQRYIQEAKTGDISFIAPWFHQNASNEHAIPVWESAMRMAESAYKRLIDAGCPPEAARTVLPNSTACRIIMSANLREWRHIFELRCSVRAYPPMRSLMLSLLKKAHEACPVVFDDLYAQYFPEEGA